MQIRHPSGLVLRVDSIASPRRAITDPICIAFIYDGGNENEQHSIPFLAFLQAVESRKCRAPILLLVLVGRGREWVRWRSKHSTKFDPRFERDSFSFEDPGIRIPGSFSGPFSKLFRPLNSLPTTSRRPGWSFTLCSALHIWVFRIYRQNRFTSSI